MSGAPLLLLAGKLGCLSVINCATKQLEWVGHFDYSSPGSTHAPVGEGPALLMHDTNVLDVQGLAGLLGSSLLHSTGCLLADCQERPCGGFWM